MINTTKLIAMALIMGWGIHTVAAEEPSAGNEVAAQRAFQLPDFSELVKRQGPTVVNVRVFRSKPSESTDTEAEANKRPTQPPRVTSLGSGFIVAPNGVILTNRHVVANADKIRVRFADKRELPAVVVGVDAVTDVAVLKVEAENLPTATRGDSSKLKVGQWVLAIGAPMGLERTATQGIISALGRTLPNDNYVSFIQTDVPINPGNSGGPLFDLEGRVVGINSQIVSNSGGYMGLSFAIPINVALTVARQILEKGHATHGWLGASAQEMSIELAQAYGLEAPRGALISEIVTASPADKGGLQLGDIVMALDNAGIAESADLPPLVGACQPGTEHLLTTLRDGQIIRLKVKMGELGLDNKTRARTSPLVKVDRLGVKVSDLSPATQQVLAIHGGVLVEAIEDGPAAMAGVQAGDILLKLGSFQLNGVAHLQELVAKQAAGRQVPLLIKREDDATFIAISIPKTN